MEDDKSIINIDILNEDCLIYIFEYLSFQDRINVGRVSKLWRRVASKSWTKFRTLSTILRDGTELGNKKFLYLIKRYGKYLRKISLLREEHEGDHYELLLQIPTYCKNLISLEVYPLTSLNTFYALCKNFNDIRELDVFFLTTFPIPPGDFSQFLNLKKKLRKLELYEVESLDFQIPETVEDLTLRLRLIKSSLSPKLLQNLKRLNRLRIEDTKMNQLFPIFTQPYAKNLTCLELKLISGDFGTGSYFSSLKNLEVLRLFSCNFITNNDVEKVVKECQRLKELIVNNCRLITYQFLEIISNLLNLEILHFSKHVRINSIENRHFKHLRKLKNLKQLVIKCRYSITIFPYQLSSKSFTDCINDETVCDVISAIPNLQTLVVSGFDFSQNDFRILRFAEEMTKNRTENVLEIVCKENMPEFHHDSPFLAIRRTDTVINVAASLGFKRLSFIIDYKAI